MAAFSEHERLALGVLTLAAGRSRRMGTPKLLLPWGDTTVLGHLLREWETLGARQIAVVCAADDPKLQSELDRLVFPLENRILNPEPDHGMFSSIQCGATWGSWHKGLTHIAVVLGDQPHLRRSTLQTLLAQCGAHSASICQPCFHGRARHPVILPAAEFFSLAETSCGNLREFLAGRHVSLCEVDDPGLELDIDTPEDYARALANQNAG
jgi:molybdenum cofactor cytidylyltransferase